MKRVEYAVCAVCGLNKVIYSANRASKGKPASLRWADFDVRTMEFVQVREGGGDKSGFHKISAMSLEDAVNAGGVYLGIAQGMAKQIVKVSKELKRLGLIP
jgi:hypothetical protein